ncbi:MAG: hypothetical protein J6U20_10255 [Fibrobacter sp.]|nr:hypothetical protein [Fibrobacter sp.]
MINLTKHQYKICEAVALGLTHYYMGKNDRRKLTEEERKQAELLLPVLPKGWFMEEQEWMAVVQAEKRRQSKRKKL